MLEVFAMERKNISSVHDCYGCGVCAISCPRKIIDIVLNKDGFYSPYIKDSTGCINCGICLDVCSFLHEKLAISNDVKASYAAWSNEHLVRRKCSSGGAGFEVGRKLLSEGYKICAVKYNLEKERAEHYIATTLTELIPSTGSKYIQSYTIGGFGLIKRNEKYLITGTPCQIDSFRRYIRRFKMEDNFVLMDFFCHSVPSKWLWDKYLHHVERYTGKANHVSWRNKFTGWHDSWAMSIDGEKYSKPSEGGIAYNILITERKCIYNSRLSQGDIFYKLFLGDFCSNPACSKNCKFKYDQSSADIRIGDFWGETYANNQDGVSAVVAFTDKGDEILKSLNCTLIPHPFAVVAEGQMKKNIKEAHTAKLVKTILNSNLHSLPNMVLRLIILIEKAMRIPARILKIASNENRNNNNA